MTRSTTARVRNIAEQTTKEQLIKRVSEELQTTVVFSSLAPGFEANSSKSKTATITFDDPTPLKAALTLRRTGRLLDGNVIQFDKNFLGMTTLTEHAPGSTVDLDIIALHGLGGHAFNTWASHENGFMWLRDALPKDMPSARILTWGYNANLLSQAGISNIPEFAQEFLSSLLHSRPGDAKQRPLILLAHSLGGIIVKKAMVTIAEKGRETELSSLRDKIKGVVFLGTPHRGGNGVTLGVTIASFLTAINIGARRDLIAALDPKAPILQDIGADFREHFKEKIKAFSFREDLPMTFGIWPVKRTTVIVGPHSARLGEEFRDETIRSLNANHVDMCKFRSESDPSYEAVLDALIRIFKSFHPDSSGPGLQFESDFYEHFSWAVDNATPPRTSIAMMPVLYAPVEGPWTATFSDQAFRLTNDTSELNHKVISITLHKKHLRDVKVSVDVQLVRCTSPGSFVGIAIDLGKDDQYRSRRLLLARRHKGCVSIFKVLGSDYTRLSTQQVDIADSDFAKLKLETVDDKRSLRFFLDNTLLYDEPLDSPVPHPVVVHLTTYGCCEAAFREIGLYASVHLSAGVVFGTGELEQVVQRS